eukprot:TRINITY_DN1759_c0_g2_i1.p1 TRINITY_DN1759_c0_g2~~TRINITY_DN1759_c0_g2_i1.p1  ORF type:complete len:562 (+),score=95.49 TRINITY_DN1759_c0_g2_i1:82-1767(+)
MSHGGPFVTAAVHRNAQQSGAQLATIDAATGREHTYGQLRDRVSRFAAALRQGGLQPGARVALLMLNSDRYLEAFYAVPWAGGIVLPANIRLAPAELVEVFCDAGIEVLLVDEAFKAMLPALRPKIPSLRRVVYAGDAQCPQGCDGYEAMVSGSRPCEDAMRGGDDVFGLFYTGGTTGKPKGVMLTHTNVYVNALGHTAALQYTPESRYLHSAPMFHLADGASSFAITMAGGTHVFIPKFDPAEMLKAIEKYKVSKAMMVPVMIQVMLSVPIKSDCSSLETIMYGAAPMPEALLAPAMAKFPRACFIQGYGMTETSPAICMLTAEHHTKGNPRMRAVGKPVPWVEARIVNDKDEEVPRDAVGEIVTRGPHVMKGYWGQPQLTAETLRGGWMHTGDAGRMDKDRLHLHCGPYQGHDHHGGRERVQCRDGGGSHVLPGGGAVRGDRGPGQEVWSNRDCGGAAQGGAEGGPRRPDAPLPRAHRRVQVPPQGHRHLRPPRQRRGEDPQARDPQAAPGRSGVRRKALSLRDSTPASPRSLLPHCVPPLCAREPPPPARFFAPRPAP